MSPATINLVGLWLLRFMLVVGMVFAGWKKRDDLAAACLMMLLFSFAV